MVIIVDYGMGNLRSILYKLQKFKIESAISSSPEDIEKADKLILPGVGHFAKAMENLGKRGLISVLNKKVLEDKTPVMGICLGAQLLTRSSEEGNVPGLGWVDAETKRFDFSGMTEQLPVPHVGWNKVMLRNRPPFWPDFPEDQHFYFTHSYYISCAFSENVAGVSFYGHEFVSAVWKENIFGTQFHPEKSHRDGFELLRRFAEEVPQC